MRIAMVMAVCGNLPGWEHGMGPLCKSRVMCSLLCGDTLGDFPEGQRPAAEKRATRGLRRRDASAVVNGSVEGRRATSRSTGRSRGLATSQTMDGSSSMRWRHRTAARSHAPGFCTQGRWCPLCTESLSIAETSQLSRRAGRELSGWSRRAKCGSVIESMVDPLSGGSDCASPFAFAASPSPFGA
jgi:hypothetical protein